MNFQDFLIPLGGLMEWTFELIMEGEPGLAHWLNWMIVAVGGIGFFTWMKLQGDYNKKAQQEGSIA